MPRRRTRSLLDDAHRAGQRASAARTAADEAREERRKTPSPAALRNRIRAAERERLRAEHAGQDRAADAHAAELERLRAELEVAETAWPAATEALRTANEAAAATLTEFRTALNRWQRRLTADFEAEEEVYAQAERLAAAVGGEFKADLEFRRNDGSARAQIARSRGIAWPLFADSYGCEHYRAELDPEYRPPEKA